MQSGSHAVMAFEPTMDYWFIETLTVSDVELPAGVEILVSNPSYQPRGFLILNNKTETLLYVLSLGYKDVLVMATPDPNWKARVNGAHEVASYLVAPDKPAYLSMEALADLDPNLADQNVLTFDPPPIDVSIPAAKSSELLLVYGGQMIEVPFMLAYTLNTGFDNGTAAYLNWMMNAQATDVASATATQQSEESAARVISNNIMLIG